MNLLFAIQILGITGEAAYPIEEDSKESSKNTKKQPPHLAVRRLLGEKSSIRGIRVTVYTHGDTNQFSQIFPV